MKLDELKTAWREEMQVTQTLNDFKLKRLVKDVKKIEQEAIFGSTVFITLGIGMAILFFVISRMIELGLFQIFNFIVVLAWFGYGTHIYLRSRRSNIDDNWTLAARLSREINLVEKQKKLVRDMPLKFVAPFLLWNAIFVYTSYVIKTDSFFPSAKYLSFAGVISILVVIAGWVALYTAKDKYEPLLRQLRQLKEQIEEN